MDGAHMAAADGVIVGIVHFVSDPGDVGES